MLTTSDLIDVCKKYSARDKDYKVHCNECPLVVDKNYAMCMANSHLNYENKTWELDQEYDIEER